MRRMQNVAMALFSAIVPLTSFFCRSALCEEPSGAVKAGHSYHGEAFDEGPRQSARLMQGLAKIVFPTSAKAPEVQSFIEQGIAQLHGFWYLEAERSFRQAAFLEPELAIAYWGCAMANINQQKRANAFIAEAVKRNGEATMPREKMYIDSLDRYLKAIAPAVDEDCNKDSQTSSDSQKVVDKKDEDVEREKKRKAHEQYIADLEKIIDEYPDDYEAKAFLVLQLWLADGEGLKITSRYAVDAILDQVFTFSPLHPAHHYRIHLWDHQRPKNALTAAAKAGPSMPAVAHMWHMPGHTYSGLFRYADAAWQQEAATRVDLKHMIESRLLPDQIHNFAHNHEWMVRNLIHLGRVNDAIRHSKSLVELPCHPDFNTSKKGSFRFGRERLLQTLVAFGLWKQLIDEAAGPFLGETDSEEANDERNAWLAVAHFLEGDRATGASLLRSLQRKRLDLQRERLDAAEAKAKAASLESTDGSGSSPKSDDTNERNERIKRLPRLIARAAAAAAAKRGDKEAFNKHAKNAELDNLLRAQWLVMVKDFEEAKKLAEEAVNNGRSEVRPLAVLIDVLWRQSNKDEAFKRFEELRKEAHASDLETPLLSAMAPIAVAAGVEGDWRIARVLPDDVGERPTWDAFGPDRWQPYAAPSWQVISTEGKEIASEHAAGKPKVVFFYLGFGCLHCIEQLKAFSPKSKAFEEAGVELMAITTESLEELTQGLKNFGEPLSIPIFSDDKKVAFKEFRCWDDFESVPLHGTFLIDGKGRVRWQDIGADPFNDADFLLNETKRLLSLPD